MVKFAVCLGLLCLLSLLAPGCNRGPRMVPVSGTVKLDGKPLAGASVMFVLAAGGPPVTGVTDVEGKFELSTLEPGDGCLEGDYQVGIVAYRATGVAADPASDPSQQLPGATGNERVTWIVPQTYSVPAESGLTAKVSADSENIFEFDVASK